MIDVFLCHVPGKGRLRDAMYNLVRARWLEEPSANLRIVTPKRLGCTSYDFQKQRRIWAEDHAKGSLYVVADDDRFPETPEPFLAYAMRILEKWNNFAVLAPWDADVPVHQGSDWTPDWEGYTAVSEPDVMEHVSVGGIRFRRKIPGLKYPEQVAKTYDSQEAEAFRERGLRSGYIRSIRAVHLGKGASTIWP